MPEPSDKMQYREALKTLSSSTYRDGSAVDKQRILWEYISRYPYAKLPPANATTLRLAIRLINRSALRQVFDVTEDVRPPRTKAFHPVGTVAQIRFTADGQHPFTGLFASGALGVGRMSLTLGDRNWGPSCAFKLLFDGPFPSENLLLDQSVDTQTSRDIFERTPTNYTLWPTQYPIRLIWPLVNWWLKKIADPMYRPLDHLAERTSDGAPVAHPVAPKLVYLHALDEVHTDPRSQLDFREVLAVLAPGTALYRVFGADSGADQPVYIGTITTQSKFVASQFGDRILSLRHASIPGDTAPPD